MANFGLGKDIWTVPFDDITAILKIYFFDEDLYLTALPLVKISILLFYLRIFPQTWFRYACLATMAACVGYGIAFLLVSVFQCQPIDLAWNHWDGEHPGKCNDINAQGWTSAALNVVLDIVVLALPMPVIAKLELNKRKKALVVLMFSTGFLVTIISIIRLQVLVHFGGTTNFTCLFFVPYCIQDFFSDILQGTIALWATGVPQRPISRSSALVCLECAHCSNGPCHV